MTAARNAFKLVFALLLLLLLQHYVIHRETVYYNSDEYSTIDDSEPLRKKESNPKSDPDPVDVATHNSQLQVISSITPESEVLFPYPNITHLPHDILNSPWATEMKAKLEAAKIGKQLTYVTVSMNYFSVLLNWLIYAKSNAMPLLENLLVVCMDKPSHNILSQKGMLSQLVRINDIIYSIKDMDGSGIFSARVITRLTILRLLNYWGYDVLIMDIDAILINNIQPIFDHLHDSDIISSTANAPNCLPSAARKAWSFCLCIGLLLIRGNANTGMSAIYT